MKKAPRLLSPLLQFIVILLILSIPIGFGFGLAVFLKREFENPRPQPTEQVSPPASKNVLDLLKASSVTQDILFAKNKVQDSEEEQPAPQENKLNEFLGEDATPLPQEPEIAAEPEQEPTPEVTPEPASQYDFDEQEEEEDEDDQDDLLARAMSNLRETPSEEPSPEETAEEEQVGQDFDFEAFKQAVDELQEETEPAEETPEELQEDDAEPAANDAEPVAEDVEPAVEDAEPVDVEKKVTEKTFEEFSIFESVPENLLDAHLCMEQEPLPEEMVGVHDLLAVVPDALLNQFEVEPQIGAENFVQTEDAVITLKKKAKK